MRLLYPLLLWSVCLVFFSTQVKAQLPPNQPEQDCISALPVCQNMFTQPNSYVGEGVDDDEIDGTNSCLAGGETNGVWYIFTVQAAGNVSFVINPVAPLTIMTGRYTISPTPVVQISRQILPWKCPVTTPVLPARPVPIHRVTPIHKGQVERLLMG